MCEAASARGATGGFVGLAAAAPGAQAGVGAEDRGRRIGAATAPEREGAESARPAAGKEAPLQEQVCYYFHKEFMHIFAEIYIFGRSSGVVTGEVEIHVCDEVNGLKKTFHCPQALLVTEMAYFAHVTAGHQWFNIFELN